MKVSKKLVIIAVSVLVLLIGGVVVYATTTTAARAESQLNLGNKYLQEGKYQEAILAFQKVIEIEQKNIPARLGLGKVYVAMNELLKAEAVLKEVIQLDANNLTAREDLFDIYIIANNLDAANSILQEMTKVDPNIYVNDYNSILASSKAINASKASYDQGVKQMGDKQYLEAVNSFEKVVREDSERYSDAQAKVNDCKKAFVDTILQNAKNAAANKDYKTALDLLDQILKVDSNNQDASRLKNDYTSTMAAIQNEEKKIHSLLQTPIGNGEALIPAAQGIIPGLDFKIGDLGKNVLSRLGNPQAEGTYEGSYYLSYKDVTYFVLAYSKQDVSNAPIVGIALRVGKPFGVQIGKTLLKDVSSILGKPTFEPSFDKEDGDWKMLYQFGNYKVFFISNGLNSPVQALELQQG